MLKPLLTTVLRLLAIATLPLIPLTDVQAQAVVTTAVEECDDPHGVPDGPRETISISAIAGRLCNPESGVTIEAPEALLRRTQPGSSGSNMAESVTEDAAGEMEQERAVRTKSGKTVGFRVQVYADNNARSAKVEARQRERAIEQQFPGYTTYVSYASPYWRLRVGDFTTQYDAEKAASEIRKAFPRYAKEVRVVRDRIAAH